MKQSASSGNALPRASPPVFYAGGGYSNRMAQMSGAKPLAENLTPMERKIIKKLKDTARGKNSVAPVKAQRASRSAKKVYSSSSNRRQLNNATGGRVNKTEI